MLYAILAYTAWGFIPVYLKLLGHLPITQVLVHRSLWAFLFFSLVIWITSRRMTHFSEITKRQRLSAVASAFLLTANWTIYLYAVNTNQVVEGSLGYFINPLVNFLLGFVFLGERLPRLRQFAVGLATLGVLWLTFQAGEFPWIGISLGLSFGFYGMIRKVNPLPASSALQIEMFLVFFIMLAGFYFFQGSGASPLPLNGKDALLLAGSGLATGLPLFWFNKGLGKTPLNVMGFLQFIAPTLQFLFGVFLYGEAFPFKKFIGFLLIWAGVMLLILELIFNPKRRTDR